MRQPSIVAEEIYLSVIVPVWNTGDHLSAALDELLDFIRTRAYRAELILANDGNGLETTRLLEDFSTATAATVSLLNFKHRGKGAAIAAAMQSARGAFRIFIDADLAYSASEIERLLQELKKGADVVVASRVHPDSRYVMSPRFIGHIYTRHLMSRVLNAAVRALLLPGLVDTQAGLKGFTAEAARVIFPQITIPGFGFDLECLYIARANGLRTTQVPVVMRYDQEVSGFRFLRDGVTILTDILRVRLKGWVGAYTVPDCMASTEVDFRAPVLLQRADAETVA